MSTGVVHKNLYDLLGNDIEDENETPSVATKEVVKQVVTSKKRDDPPPSAVAPTNTDGGRGGYNRRGRGDGNDAAFRDRNAGRFNNRAKTTDEESTPSGDRPYRPRGGRGSGGGGRGRDHDRHSASARQDTDKQVSQGWGSTKGTSEWDDEKAGESIAQADATDEPFVPITAEETGETTEAGEPVVAAAEPEPEDTTKSYAEYLAERAKANPVAELPEARAPNEGAREDKKWAAAKELKKEEDEEYFASSKSKKLGSKQRKEKTVIEIDPRFTEPKDRGRGDRGGARGRGGRGGERGGDRGGRGRGGESRGDRRNFGGPRGGANGAAVNIEDSSAFPSLGQ